jgi:hypothetical protein
VRKSWLHMRWLRVAATAAVLSAWLVGSAAQQGTPPAGTPPAGTPPASTPPPTPPASTPPPAAPAEEEEPAGAPSDEAAKEVFIPTEELQPDAAVTFPVDI